MREIEAIVLAGGFGTRMGSAYKNQQKCLLPIEGKPLLLHVIDNLHAAFGSVDLIIGVGHRGDAVKQFVQRNVPRGSSVTFVPHTPGTEGWGIYLDIKDYITGHFVATPGDIVAHPSMYEGVVYQYESSYAEAAMTLSPELSAADTHGVGVASDGMMKELQWPPPQIIHGGYKRDVTIWASNASFFDVIADCPRPGKSIGFVFMDAIRGGRPIAANETELPWFHLGYPHDLLHTEGVQAIDMIMAG